MKILTLNAPMLSGKDEISKAMVAKGAVHMEIKELLIDIAVRMAGITRALWDAMYTRDYKERPSPYLLINGIQVSPRDWLIHISEKVMKPVFGEDVFGQALKVKIISRNLPDDAIVVLSDGGFPDEAMPNIELVGGENFFIARIHRYGEDGKEFGWGTDSRSYLYNAKLPKTHQVNESDFGNYHGKMSDCVEKIWSWVNEEKK